MSVWNNVLTVLGFGVKKAINIELQQGTNQKILKELLELKSTEEIRAFLSLIVPTMNREERGILRSCLRHESQQAFKTGDQAKGRLLKQAAEFVDEVMRFQHMLDADWQ